MQSDLHGMLPVVGGQFLSLQSGRCQVACRAEAGGSSLQLPHPHQQVQGGGGTWMSGVLSMPWKHAFW